MIDLAPYRLWHKALLRSDRKKWSKKVATFLGPFDGLAFEPWWEGCSEYFSPPEPFTVVPIEEREEAEMWWQEYGDDSSVKLLYVNLHKPTSILVRDFERLLREIAKNRRGRPSIDQTLVDFPLARYPNCDLIEKMLRCYDLWASDAKRIKVERRTLYQIGVISKVSHEYVVKDVNDHSLEAAENRKLMSITTSRMIKRAKALIENVEKGIFPIY